MIAIYLGRSCAFELGKGLAGKEPQRVGLDLKDKRVCQFHTFKPLPWCKLLLKALHVDLQTPQSFCTECEFTFSCLYDTHFRTTDQMVILHLKLCWMRLLLKKLDSTSQLSNAFQPHALHNKPSDLGLYLVRPSDASASHIEGILVGSGTPHLDLTKLWNKRLESADHFIHTVFPALSCLQLVRPA